MPKVLETSENAKKDYLKTHYYKGNATKMLEEIKQDFENKGFQIVNLNFDYNELSVHHDMYDMTIKAFQFSITEVAVDVFIDSRFLFDFTKTKRVLVDFYDRLNKKYELLGLALYK